MAIDLVTINLASLCNKKNQLCATNYILQLNEFTSNYQLNQAESISACQHEVTDMYPILFQVFKESNNANFNIHNSFSLKAIHIN